MSGSMHFLILVDEDRRQFTVEGPVRDCQSWSRAVEKAREDGRNLKCCDIGSTSPAEAIAKRTNVVEQLDSRVKRLQRVDGDLPAIYDEAADYFEKAKVSVQRLVASAEGYDPDEEKRKEAEELRETRRLARRASQSRFARGPGIGACRRLARIAARRG